MISITEIKEFYIKLLKDLLKQKKELNNGNIQLTNEKLCQIIRRTEFQIIEELAAQIILMQEPNNKELCCIILYVKSRIIKEITAQMLLMQNPTNNDLCCIIIELAESESRRKEAWQKLLEQIPISDVYETNDILCRIINQAKSLKVAAAEELLKNKKSLTCYDIYCILDNIDSPELRKEAKDLLQKITDEERKGLESRTGKK